MCRMFLANKPQLTAPYMAAYISHLESSQGGGGMGMAWYSTLKEGALQAVKDVNFRGRHASTVADMLSEVQADTTHPYLFHIRGSINSSHVHVHPHSSDPLANWVTVGQRMYGNNLRDALVHNGDTNSRDYSAMALRLVKQHGMEAESLVHWGSIRGSSVPGAMDTMLLAYLVGFEGSAVLPALNMRFGSTIYTKPGENGPEYHIYRGLSGGWQGDYTPLCFIRWDEDSWLIASENHYRYTTGATVYPLKMGLWTLDQILSLEGVETERGMVSKAPHSLEGTFTIEMGEVLPVSIHL